jgi:signal transduction histidine kinase
MDRVSAAKAKPVNDYGRFSRKLANTPVSLEDLLPQSAAPTSAPQNHAGSQPAVRQLEQISVAAHAFATELDLQKLLDELARQARGILRAEQVIIYSHLDQQLQAMASEPSQMDLSEVAGEDVVWCVRYRKPRVNNQPVPGGIRNSLCVPLVSTQSRVLGVIEARNKRLAGTFTEQDIRLANCLARVACSSVDRARLFFRIEDWQQSIETLLSFNATVNQQLEPARMVRELVANVTGFLDATGGAAGILIREEQVPVAVCDSFFYEGQTYPIARRWKPREGIPGVVIETEFPLLVDDYRQNPLADPELAARFDIGSCICVPIKNPHEEVLGFFKLHRRQGQPQFTWQDAAFLESLGNTAAVAIENARLVKSLELKNRQIKNLSEHHLRRLEEERHRIARELHDETGQVLVGLKLRLQVLSGLLNDNQAAARQELTGLRQQLNQAASQLKDLAKRLRPPTLDQLGFEASLRQLVAEYRKQFEFGIHVHFEDAPRLTGDAETALFRIAQESLTNIAKHSQADRVDITFARSRGFREFSVHDNGRGFDPERATAGLGLIGIRERVKMLGGEIDIHSAAGQGTRIEIKLPESHDA